MIPVQYIQSCDLFCTVVDNYGDIGIASRLVRQLHDEQHLQVRLWIDDLRAFKKLHPAISTELDLQDWYGVEVRHWVQRFPDVVPFDMVVEAFGCDLPEPYLSAMVVRSIKPVWINLEYLTAEAWVQGCHGLASPHPRLPLTKYFFFPGYTSTTGGLLRERGLVEAVRNFQGDSQAQAAFWRSLNIPAAQTNEIRVSLFAYENPAIPSLLESFARYDRPVTCVLPMNKALGPALKYLARSHGHAWECYQDRNLSVRTLPFLPQDTYDRLLWACDVNVVRGEDSFVRAQFAGRSLLWQAYTQEGDTHEKKVRAWLGHYLAGVPSTRANEIQDLFIGWNRGTGISPSALEILEECSGLARSWGEALARLPSLSESLVMFAKKAYN
jgi:uncharacterized repeat protein (TIGR03837 family)